MLKKNDASHTLSRWVIGERKLHISGDWKNSAAFNLESGRIFIKNRILKIVLQY